MTPSTTKFTIFIFLFYQIRHVSSKIRTTSDSVCAPNPLPISTNQKSSPYAFSLPLSTCSKTVKKSLKKTHPDQNKITPEILESYNYPYETHEVITEDGYILTVYRITGSPNKRKKRVKRKPSVYLQHGLGGASDCWLFQPGSRNLPFKLADAGYDVWLSNSRGTTYSFDHIRYNAHTDLAYWDFSWHEHGVYDTPAVTDKIIEVSGNPKIFYIGHSQGTTQYFVSVSEIPEMNDKILAGIMFAPVIYMGHMNSPTRMLFPVVNPDAAYKATNILMHGRIANTQELRAAANVSEGDMCAATALKCGLCDNFIFMLFGYNAPQINNVRVFNCTELPNMAAKYPNYSSVKCYAHYAQSASTCSFRHYDYGAARNLHLYKNKEPPTYKLENIRAPLIFFYSDNDNMAPPNDVKITASKLSPGVLKGMIKVKDKLFNHVDFVTAKDADKLLYKRVMKEMKKFL